MSRLKSLNEKSPHCLPTGKQRKTRENRVSQKARAKTGKIMSNKNELPELDLTALVASRICHDVVGPVGAIFNGLEVLEDDDDEQVKQYAMDVIAAATNSK